MGVNVIQVMPVPLIATGVEPPPDSDQGLVNAGYAALTTIVGVAEAWPPDDGMIAGVEERVVPGAPLEAVHRVPDASQPRSLRRPVHAGASRPSRS